ESVASEAATRTAWTAYTVPTPAAPITQPPSAGPVVKASAWLVDAIVTARGNSSRGTSVGSRAARDGLSNAQATPTSATTAYRRPRFATPSRVATQRTTAQASGIDCATIMIFRRS